MAEAGWLERGVGAARNALGGSWTATPLHGTGGGVHGSGVVRLDSSDDSVIVKVVARNDLARDAPTWWRRELEAYRSAWLRRSVPTGFELPTCRWSTETDDAAVMVLDEVPFDDPATRPIGFYEDLARGLGELAARPIGDVPDWASRGFVAHEASTFAAAAPSLAATPAPLIEPIIRRWRTVLAELAPMVPELLARLDDEPIGFAHLDAFSRNAAPVAGGIVMIDWSYAGLAPIGADAAGIVAMTSMHADTDRFEIAELCAAVTAAFADGVAAGRGAVDQAQLRSVIETLLVLRWVTFLTQANALGEGLEATTVAVTGRSVGEVTAAFTALSDFVLPLAEQLVERR